MRRQVFFFRKEVTEVLAKQFRFGDDRPIYFHREWKIPPGCWNPVSECFCKMERYQKSPHDETKVIQVESFKFELIPLIYQIKGASTRIVKEIRFLIGQCPECLKIHCSLLKVNYYCEVFSGLFPIDRARFCLERKRDGLNRYLARFH